MNKRYRVILMFVALAACLPLWSAHAADGPGYSLEDCLRIGWSNSLALENARYDRSIAEARVSEVWASALPKITLSSSYTRLDETQSFELEGESVALGTSDNYQLQAEVRQPLYSGGRVGIGLRSAGLMQDMAEADYADKWHQLIRDIKIAFNASLLADATVVVHEQSLKQLSDLLEQTKARHARGMASDFDLLTAEVRVANERPSLIAASNRLALALTDLMNLLDIDAAEFSIEGELSHSPYEQAVHSLQKNALKQRPQLLSARAGRALQAEYVTAASSFGKPSLDAFFSYNGANSYGFASFDDEWQWHWNAGVSLSWTLWDSGETSSRVRQQQLELMKVENSTRELEQTVSLEVQRAFLELTHAENAIEAGGESVVAAEKAMTIARKRYDEGLSTYLEYTDSNLALSRARLVRLQSLHAQLNAFARLQYACGITQGIMEQPDSDISKRPEGDK